MQEGPVRTLGRIELAALQKVKRASIMIMILIMIMTMIRMM